MALEIMKTIIKDKWSYRSKIGRQDTNNRNNQLEVPDQMQCSGSQQASTGSGSGSSDEENNGEGSFSNSDDEGDGSNAVSAGMKRKATKNSGSGGKGKQRKVLNSIKNVLNFTHNYCIYRWK